MDDPSSNNTLPDLGHHRHNLSSSGVSPLEQEVLDEYERLARNMEKLSTTLTLLTTPSPPTSPTTTATTTPQLPTPQLTHSITESLRLLERQVASVYTLMKASVYSIVLQQGEMLDPAGNSGGGGSRGEESSLTGGGGRGEGLVNENDRFN